MTNKLLFEAVGLHLFERWGNMHYRVDGGSLEDPALEAILPQMISVLEQSNNLTYRSQANYNNTAVPSFTYRAAATYVTGSHAFKFGFNNTQGHLDEYNYTLNNLSYRFNNGVPNQITERAFPYRVDHQPRQRSRPLCAGSLDGQSLDHPGSASGSTTSRPASRNRPSGRRISRRTGTSPSRRRTTSPGRTSPIGAALPTTCSATGKTAVKVAFNKYLLGQTLNGLGRNPNPVLTLVTLANRPWNDRGGLGINGDYVPQCDLPKPGRQRRVRPVSTTLRSAPPSPSDLFDQDLDLAGSITARPTGSSRPACSTRSCSASRSTSATSAAPGPISR